MKLYLLLFFCTFYGAIYGKAQPNYPAGTYRLSKSFVNEQLQSAVTQIKILAKAVPPKLMPRTFQGDTLVTSNTAWWTSGFFPGTLWYLYEFSRDEQLKQYALQKLSILEKEKYNKGTHDLGFMLNCSFGNALRISRDTLTYKDILVTGASSLITRYSPVVKAIRSWSGWNYPVIIDNMMNLEFLLEVYKLTGNSRFKDIALAHANTTMQNHFRSDYSCYHVVDYNPSDGSVIAKKTFQGAYDESAWARGQAWALYGYTMMYRETNDEKYLNFAEKIAEFILGHPNWPSDGIPYWDFNAPDLPVNSPLERYKANRDAAAATILASAFIELSGYNVGNRKLKYIRTAEKILLRLSKPPYKSPAGGNGGFILTCSAGTLPRNIEVNVPLTYADYYYVEALMRYKNILNRSSDPRQVRPYDM